MRLRQIASELNGTERSGRFACRNISVAQTTEYIVRLDPAATDMDAGVTDEEAQTNAVNILSCEHCRRRKIRCDRKEPCTPCSLKQVKCSFPAGFKPRPRRQRALVSNSYEDKIDGISRKLDRICLFVDNIQASPITPSDGSRSTQPSVSTQNVSKYSGSSPGTHSYSNSDVIRSELEGNISLTTYAAFATNFIQEAMDNSRSMTISPEMTSSLEALRAVIETSSDQSMSGSEMHPQLIVPGAKVESVQMPPMELAMSCLQKLKDNPRVKFFWIFEVESVGQFAEYVLTVYSGEPSIADQIIVNSGLDRLFTECSNVEPRASLKSELTSQGHRCQQNLELLLSRLPFHLPFNMDYTLALTMAAKYYLDRGKPLLAWNCVVAASNMSQTLGFHREDSLGHTTSEEKRRRIRLFWCICLLDKMLVLRLGKPSTIGENSITVGGLDHGNLADRHLTPVLPKWMDMALVQSKVYDDILSPAALRQSESVRVVRARALATELQAIFNTGGVLESRYNEERRQAVGEPLHELFLRADKVCYLVTLTSIYHSIPPLPYSSSAFCEECLSAAQDALQEHQNCIALLKLMDGNMAELYIQWALLASPFLPFIVLFCHIVETCDPVHLEMLAAVAETMEMVPVNFPEVYKKQLRLFKHMYGIACMYVEARDSAAREETQHRISDSDFDMLFREAGIAVNPFLGIPSTSRRHYQHVSESDLGMGSGDVRAVEESSEQAMEDEQGTQVGDWLDQHH